jgi:hypothetical protein
MLQARLQRTGTSSSGAWLQSVFKHRNSCTLMLRLTSLPPQNAPWPLLSIYHL